MGYKWLSTLAAGIAIGLFLSFLLSCAFLLMLKSPSETVRALVLTHLPNVITLLVAALGLWGISKQIQSNVDLDTQARQAKLEAVKATLPIVLSNITDLANERIYALAYGKRTNNNNAKWTISETDLSTLKECIEHAAGTEKALMQKFCYIYQILTARLGTLTTVNLFLEREKVDEPGIFLHREQQCGAIANWAELQAIRSSLFPYARGEKQEVNNEQTKQTTLSIMDRLRDGALTGEVGLMLTNNPYFSDYLAKLQKAGKFEFLE